MVSMKIDNKLNESDFLKIKEALADESVNYIELHKEINLGFVVVAPLTITPSDEGYILQTRIVFDDPLGNTVCVNAGIEERGITKSAHDLVFVVKKTIITEGELKNDIDYGFLLIEKVVNYSCGIRDEKCCDSFTVNSRFIERQIEKSKK